MSDQINGHDYTPTRPATKAPMTYHWMCTQCDVPVMRLAAFCPGCGTPQPKRV